MESMSGAGPSSCLATLPCTLFGTYHVVFGHLTLRGDRQAMNRRSMVSSEGSRPLEESTRAA